MRNNSIAAVKVRRRDVETFCCSAMLIDLNQVLHELEYILIINANAFGEFSRDHHFFVFFVIWISFTNGAEPWELSHVTGKD